MKTNKDGGHQMMNAHQIIITKTFIETGAGSEDQIPPLRTQMCAQFQQVATLKNLFQQKPWY